MNSFTEGNELSMTMGSGKNGWGQKTRRADNDNNNDTIVGSNGFVRRLKQQSTNKMMTDTGGEEHIPPNNSC